VLSLVQAEAARHPAQDGKDGLGMDDLQVLQPDPDDGRLVLLRFTNGTRTRDFRITIPGLRDAGVWRDSAQHPGVHYRRGDCCSWGGSLHICTADGATDKPATGGPGWRMAVKAGRDLRVPTARDARDTKRDEPVAVYSAATRPEKFGQQPTELNRP
jgi:hypothetical protein